MARKIVLAFLAAVAFLAAPGEADACSCGGGIPLCQTVWNTSRIFTGRIDKVEVVKEERGYQRHRVTVSVTESFRGGSTGVIEIATGLGGGDCGYAFVEGRDYLIYAHESQGQLSTSICSRTQPIESATEDIAYLRAIPALAPRLGQIGGRVEREVETATERKLVPVAGVRISLSNSETPATVVTDQKGEFTFFATAGKHRVTIELPDSADAGGPRDVDLLDTRGCVAANFYVRDNGRVSGRLVEGGGLAVPHFGLNLGRIRKPGGALEWSYDAVVTDENGRFKFNRVEDGALVVGRLDVGVLGRTTLGRGGQLASVGDLVLPASIVTAPIEGIVMGADGKPSVGAKVYLFPADPRDSNMRGGAVETGANGAFRLTGIEGGQYRLEAETERYTATGSSGAFQLKRDQPPVLITLKKRSGG